MEELAVDHGDLALGGFELDFYHDGVRRRRPLGAGWNIRFEQAPPVRPFDWSKGGTSFAGWYYSVTNADHVGYESWLERDRLILLDADPEVRGIASQPFWLHWHDGVRRRRHAPDYFVRLADGRGRVIDVRADDQIDDAAAQAFEASQRACRSVGWEFARVGVPDPVLMANMRWLARYRRRRCGDRRDVADELLRVFGQPTPLRAGACSVGDPLLVLPVLFHLLWMGVLAADIGTQLLGSDSLVHAAKVAGR
ncbi:TnsA-like heteromeric transposase endonuclease subunit [Sphaerisporangium album]|uniref:TnsA-like heteromeric transposase endonuclease subunit n=1 Tax=Sphaerisporangium album TaxID=509200 RepID=UPI001C6938C9|nr:TnsA-like heteromeric transposase endonuclease subunit [Sphaerisporangium album]